MQRFDTAVMAHHQFKQMFFLCGIHRLHRIQESRPHAELLGSFGQRLHVLGETRATITGTRIDEMPADARV